MMSDKIKVGIVTMHRVINAGSILQAYALYKVIEKLGYDCEIIDYMYPNYYHMSNDSQHKDVLPFWKLFLLRLKYFVLYRSRKQRKRFIHFMEQKLKLSNYYATPEEIEKNPPTYDIYMTGSDQVWNPQVMKGDPTFFCDFASSHPKIAYASSFSKGIIPVSLKENYSHFLNTYNALGIREQSGLKIIKDLTKRDAEVVCDPTLLLTRHDYISLSKDSLITKKEPYILVYALSYAYNPYPTIQLLIDKVSKALRLKVYYLYANSVEHYHMGKSITSAGPNEFINLFMNASFVITSSFHGTAFALNFEKPFYSVIPENEDVDGRIFSLLKEVHAASHAIRVGSDLNNLTLEKPNYSIITPFLNLYREKSLSFLKKSLKETLD